MARGGAGAYLLLAIGLATVLLLIVLVGERPLPIGGNILSDLQLTEEVLPPQTLYATTLNLEPGQVYQITYDANGLSLVQRGTQLIERINLTGNIAVNDVIAPSIYEWYFDGIDDYVVFNLTTPWHLSTSERFGTLATKFVDYDPQRLIGASLPHTGIALLQSDTRYFLFGISVYTPTKVVGYFNGLGHFGYTDIGFDITGRWIDAIFGYHVIDANNTQVFMWINGSSAVLPNNGLYVYTDNRFGLNANANKLQIGWSGWYEPDEWLNGKVSYVVAWKDLLSENDIVNFRNGLVENAEFIVSATFTNGTHFFDLITGAIGIPSGGVAHIPAEEPFLWLVKSLESDNRLHLTYVPAGSLFRVKYGGMVYEWRIPSDCANAVGLCEDFPVDIAGVVGQTVLPNATVELVYPSAKVRFYVPSGFRVVVEGGGWSETHDVPLNTGFVDFTLPRGGAYTVRVLGYEEEPRVQVQTSGDTARVIVTDRSGYALAGAKVWVYDGNGNLAAAGATDDMGVYEFDKSQISGDQARIVVTHLSNGKYYTSDKLVNLSASSPTITVQQPVDQVASAANNSGSTGTIVLVLLLGMVIVLLATGNRRAHVLVMLLAFGAMAATVHADTQAPLAWRDTGFDLAPGYRHTISMHVTYTNFPFYHRAGEASVQAGPLRAELVSDMDLLWGFTYRFNIYVHGDRVYDEDIDAGFVGRNSVDRVVQVEVDCNGNAIVYVDGQQVGGFTINGNIDILKNEVDGAEVRVTGSRLYSCSSSGTQPGTGTVPPNPPPADSELLNSIGRAMGTAALAAFAALLLGGVALLLLAGYRQARKRRLV